MRARLAILAAVLAVVLNAATGLSARVPGCQADVSNAIFWLDVAHDQCMQAATTVQEIDACGAAWIDVRLALMDQFALCQD